MARNRKLSIMGLGPVKVVRNRPASRDRNDKTLIFNSQRRVIFEPVRTTLVIPGKI